MHGCGDHSLTVKQGKAGTGDILDASPPDGLERRMAMYGRELGPCCLTSRPGSQSDSGGRRSRWRHSRRLLRRTPKASGPLPCPLCLDTSPAVTAKKKCWPWPARDSVSFGTLARRGPHGARGRGGGEGPDRFGTSVPKELTWGRDSRHVQQGNLQLFAWRSLVVGSAGSAALAAGADGHAKGPTTGSKMVIRSARVPSSGLSRSSSSGKDSSWLAQSPSRTSTLVTRSSQQRTNTVTPGRRSIGCARTV